MKIKMLRETVGFGLVASLLLLGACSSESPTAPTGSGGGTTTPPVGAAVVLTVSNANPVVSSTSTITASVTDGGKPVANGTAVEFSTDFGTFTDTAAATTIRTTTNGVATATLTSSQVGAANVTVRVNNVSRTTAIVFKTQSTGGETRPSITSVSPATSNPAGGKVVIINGTNFVAPVSVLFGTKQATVVSVTPTQIQAIVPAIDLGATAQFKEVTVTVITQAGTTSEQSATSSAPFRYQIDILTPTVYTVSPASGPNEGNTRITIIGEGFQAPVRVFFGTGGGPGPLADQIELDVQQVNFGQIIAMTPPALGLGTQLRDKQVVIRVLNVNSNKDAILPAAFRYGPLMNITAAGPTQGPAEGGTRVTINGWGFDDPVAVSIGGVAAQVIRVSGTEIVAITSAVALESCTNVKQAISVTNIEDGGSATGPVFTYIVQTPAVVGVSPVPLVSGQTGTITVANPGPGPVTIKVGDQGVIVTSAVVNGDGTVTYSFIVPSGLAFNTRACAAAGVTAPIATAFPIIFTNTQSKCDTTAQGLKILVQPPAVGDLVVSPVTVALTTTTGVPTTGVFNIVNDGNGPLNIVSVTQLSGTACGITGPAFVPTTLNGACSSISYPVTFSGASRTCTAIFEVAADNGQRAQVTVTGTATPPAGP